MTVESSLNRDGAPEQRSDRHAEPAAEIPTATAAQAKHYGWQLVRRYRRGFVALTAWQLGAAAAAAVSPWVIGQLVEVLSQGQAAVSTVNALMIGLVVATAVQAVATWLGERQSSKTAEDVFQRVRDDFMESVVKLPAGLVERTGTGDLVSRATDDVNKLTTLVRFAIPAGLVQGCTLVASVIGCIVAGGWVAAVLAITCVVVALAGRFYVRYARRGYVRVSRAKARFESTLAETVHSAETVDALALGEVRRKTHRDRLRALYLAESYTLRLRTLVFPAIDLGVLLPAALAVVWGLWLVSRDWATVAQVTAVVLYMIRMNSALAFFAVWIDEFQLGEVALARLHGVSLVQANAPQSGAEPQGATVAVSDVSFAYSAGPTVLRDVSLTVRKGEKLAIVGRSGSGKSTLARLIAGVERSTQGEVLLGGVPVADVSPARRHHDVMLLTQEGHVFATSLRSNLLLAAPGSDDTAIRSALALVGAHWVDALPKGLDTVVGDGGVALDPAEAQHVALARVILANPRVVILDEATSLVGPESAAHLERSLAGVLLGRTVISIAHQLRVAAEADRVVVMDDGKIVEVGSHDDLVAAGGAYATLWQSWSTGR